MLLITQTNPGKMWEGCEYSKRNAITSENLVERRWLPSGVHTLCLLLSLAPLHLSLWQKKAVILYSEEAQVVKLSINSQPRSGAY